MSRFSTRARLGATLMAVGLIAAACGGDSEGATDESGIASAAETSVVESPESTETSVSESPDSTETSATDLDAPDDIEDAFALFGECMTDAGFDFITEIGGAEGGISLGGPVSGGVIDADPQDAPISPDDFDPEAFDAANDECSEHLQGIDAGFDLSPEQQIAFEDAQLEFTDCMNDLGVEVPDFDGGTGGGVVIIESVEVDIDPQTGLPSFGDDDFDFEKFNEASEECSVVYEKYSELDGLFGPTP